MLIFYVSMFSLLGCKHCHVILQDSVSVILIDVFLLLQHFVVVFLVYILVNILAAYLFTYLSKS